MNRSVCKPLNSCVFSSHLCSSKKKRPHGQCDGYFNKMGVAQGLLAIQIVRLIFTGVVGDIESHIRENPPVPGCYQDWTLVIPQTVLLIPISIDTYILSDKCKRSLRLGRYLCSEHIVWQLKRARGILIHQMRCCCVGRVTPDLVPGAKISMLRAIKLLKSAPLHKNR